MSKSILFVHQGYELYGSDRTFIQSVAAARARWPDARITVLIPQDGPLRNALLELVSDLRIENLAILRKSDLKKMQLGSIGGFVRKIFKARKQMRAYDVTYINTVIVMDYMFAGRLSWRPRILHVHEIPTGVARIFFSMMAALSGAFLVFNSEATRRSFLLLPWQRSSVVWNGVASRGVGHAKVPQGKLRFLLIGRINSWKGQGLVLRAIAQLPAEVRDRISVRFVGGVFGDQDHFTQELVRLIGELQLSGIVEMCPFVPDPSAHYEWADVVLVPSTKPEPFGLVAIEAMATGCAVIVANHGGLAEIVVDGVTGTFVVPGEVDSLSAAITSYVENPARAKAEGIAGRERFTQVFEESHYKTKIADIIAELGGPAWT